MRLARASLERSGFRVPRAGESLTMGLAVDVSRIDVVAPPAERASSQRGTRNAERASFALAATALVLAAVATRLPFMTQTLYGFDSANYALAVRDFYNVAFHQPHPPGYPLYVLFAKVIDVFTHDANRALILEGIIWSAVAVACTTLLARALFGRALGLLSGILLL